jgi:hypothetical protein
LMYSANPDFVYFDAAIGGNKVNFGRSSAVWAYGNSFRLLGPSSEECLGMESGRTNALAHFKTSQSGFSRVVSVELPIDPFYGWVFVKQ